ncbi:hypothetical protein G6F31_020316 [Rhizopus arrhizus]|nr:hypothetical protein G6F31_020316 [Rhizopus arrhizus]
MWIQSMTATAIREAYKGLRPASAYARLGDAARSRSEADWLVGINGTRAVSALSEALTERRERSSVGRVQTPTLAIVVHQELAIRAFVARHTGKCLARSPCKAASMLRAGGEPP